MCTELERLQRGPELSESPGGIGTVRFIAKCSGNAPDVLVIAKRTLAAALRLSSSGVFVESEWASSLPESFVKASPPFPSPEELLEYDSLSLDDRIEIDRKSGWPLRAFINLFRPDLEGRVWSWWDAAILDDNHLAVAVEITDWPFPWQSLRWLFIASGAVELQAETGSESESR